MVDANGDAFLDVVIIDTKLSSATELTLNQRAANALDKFAIKAFSGSPIKGTALPEFQVGEDLIKNGPFLKMDSNGNGGYGAIH